MVAVAAFMNHASISSALPCADFSLVDEGLLVGAAFACEAIPALVRAHAFHAVVDLRREACDDHAALKAVDVDFLHLPTPDMEAVSQADLARGVDYVHARRLAGASVLIHCQHGIGRSALLALCVMVRAGWPPLAALERAKTARPAVSPSRAQFEGWRQWLEAYARAQTQSWSPPDFEQFAAIAYRHLHTR